VADTNPNSEALKVWREKLAFLRRQEPIVTDAAQKFALQKQIEEAEAKIAKLAQIPQTSEKESPSELASGKAKPEEIKDQPYSPEARIPIPIHRKKLVILVHGIRTHAEWQGRIRHLFEVDNQIIVEPLGYGYFDVFRFLCPLGTRQKPIQIVLNKIRDALKLHRGKYDELTIVAHSFGTYIIGEILRKNPDIEPDRLLLCGCIQPAAYAWQRLPNRPRTVLNEAGSRDIWPILAKSITWGYGSTGTFGFQTPGVRDRYHNLAHSDYFKVGFAEDFWVPWIREGITKSTSYETGERPATPFYKNIFEIIPLKWILLLLLMVATYLVVHSHGAKMHGWIPLVKPAELRIDTNAVFKGALASGSLPLAHLEMQRRTPSRPAGLFAEARDKQFAE
jgi:hypothetical protein